MKKAAGYCVAVSILSTYVNVVAAQGYEQCERYEYAELKSLTQKNLQAEYCKVERHTNDIYKAIGYSSSGRQGMDKLLRDRNDCWQAMEKIARQPRFKNMSKDCPGLVRVDPLDAAIEKAKQDLERSRGGN